MSFMDNLQKTLNKDFSISVTENGAIGYHTSGRHLLDLNFSVTSLRNQSDAIVIKAFQKTFFEDKQLAFKWLFFASDVRHGLGERRLFRICLQYLAKNQPDAIRCLLPLIPEYNRWDNLWCLLDTSLCDDVISFVRDQLDRDMQQMAQEKPISLCAKWMPSSNASSTESKRLANIFIQKLSITQRQYRKMLSALRNYLCIVETAMSRQEWQDIDYSAVPSRANMLYNKAFLRNDELRRRSFLEKVKRNEAVIHADVLYPHDIVHRYFASGSSAYSYTLLPYDSGLEALWNALPDYINGTGNTLCVSDGSGSMNTPVGNTNVTCLDVANALSIYFAEHCSGEFQNRYITFSKNPQFVDFRSATSLREKIEIARSYNEVSNTNIEAVFDLILTNAVKHHYSQEDIPSNILILSDMEFDAATYQPQSSPDRTLFDQIAKRYQLAGYQMPRLVFWNICSRTQTIPLTENNLGVALVSGFSTQIMKMVLSDQTDPYQCLLEQLNTKRYQPIETALKDILL